VSTNLVLREPVRHVSGSRHLPMPADLVPRVLVADDQLDVLLALRLLLRAAGLHVDGAASVSEVRARLDAAEYDLLLMDLNYARDTTSGAEGLALLADVHARDPLLPVLVMTGWGSIDTAVEAMRRGACGFVHKPWDNEALTVAIRREVEHGRALRSTHRRAAREQCEAQAIQHALLPNDIPSLPGCDVAARWQPAATFGGDLYDVTLLGDERVAISVGDVSGKGLPAALLMANVQASVRACAALDQSPAAVVGRLNRDLSRNVALRRFVTLFVAIYDGNARRLTYCNAGHPAPLLVRADDSIVRLETGGTVIGAFEDSPFSEGTIDIAGGDRLVLFTDGITEAAQGDGVQFGDDALFEVLRAPRVGSGAREIADTILHRSQAFAEDGFQDDATVLVASFD
jgi:sigma-B regulation protein RsbU (phosphoserine phosphatase)